VGHSFSGVSSADEHACPLNGDLKLERIAFLTGRGANLDGSGS